LNNNGILDNEEFTNYVIEKATVLNNIKTKYDEIKSYSKSTVRPQEKFENKSIQKKFSNLIPKVIYLPNIDRLAFFEEETNVI